MASKTKQKISYLAIFSPFLVAISLGFAACSSSIFSGGSPDPVIQRLSANNQFAGDCEPIALSEATLTPRTARSLIGCLDAHGAIPEFRALVNALSDEELDGLV